VTSAEMTRRTPTSSTRQPTSAGAPWPRSWAAALNRPSTRARTRGDLAQAHGGLPAGDVGKIGLAVSPIDPRVVYATVEGLARRARVLPLGEQGRELREEEPVHQRRHGPALLPGDFRRPEHLRPVYQMNPGLMVTHDGGRTFVRVPEKNKHGDNHAMAFVKGDPDYILNGSDGGVYETHDLGQTWRFFENLPVTQFYKTGPRQCPAVLQRARRRAGQRQPDGAVADAQLERHLEFRLDDHLRGRRIRHRGRPD